MLKFTVDTTMAIDYLHIFSLLLRVWFVWTKTADYSVLSFLTSSFHICLLPLRKTHSQFALSSRFCQWLAANWVLEGIGNTCFVLKIPYSLDWLPLDWTNWHSITVMLPSPCAIIFGGQWFASCTSWLGIWMAVSK